MPPSMPMAVGDDERQRCCALLRSHFLLRDTGGDVVERLAGLASVEAVAAGVELFTRGDPPDGLYGVLAGRVRIYVSGPGGEEVMLNMLGPGELFGEIALIDGEPRSASAAAAEACRLMHIRRARFLPFLLENADIGLGLLQILCRRMRSVSELAEDQVLLPLPARLAKRLIALAGGTADQAPSAGATFALSQRELADMVGAARESVNRLLTAWRRAGVIALEGGRIVLLKPGALGALARLD